MKAMGLPWRCHPSYLYVDWQRRGAHRVERVHVMFGRSFVAQVAMSVFESLEPTGQVVNMGWEDIGLYCSR